MPELLTCGVCGDDQLIPLLDMGVQPLGERYENNRPIRTSSSRLRYPLKLMECQKCSLIQLSYIVDQREVFPPDHPYSTGNSATLQAHFSALASEMKAQMSSNDLVVDIGANDGTLLEAFGHDYTLVGVEPTNQALKCAEKDIIVYREFFTQACGAAIVEDLGKQAKIVTATNVLAHVPDPHDFVRGIWNLLADDGIFITENHDVFSVTEGMQIDTIYHEHLRYYSIASLSHLLAMNGLSVFKTENISTHGGSFRTFAKKTQTKGLSRRAHESAEILRNMLKKIESEGGTIAGISASTRATPIIHFARIAKYITTTYEVPNSEKIGMNIPGTTIPIVSEAELYRDQPSHAVIFAWHMADYIVPKHRKAGYKGKFIVPLPEPRMLDE